MDETPFESLDDVTEGLNVMAPWYDDNSITIQHAQAVVVGQGEYNIIGVTQRTHALSQLAIRVGFG